MTLEDLHALVAQGESDRLEFKSTTGQRTEGAKAVCAMLNSHGGHVLFGVSDRGELKGQPMTAHTQEEVDREFRRIEPAVFPTFVKVAVSGEHSVLVIRVPSNSQGPFTFDGRPYLRQGPQTLAMPRGRYEELLVEKMHPSQRWENLPVPPGVGIRDLDHEQILGALNAAVQRGRIEMPEDTGISSILRGFDLIKDGDLLQAALALFGKADQLKILYPQFSLSLGRFRGLDMVADFADNRRYWGNAFHLLHRAERFLLDHTHIASRLVGKMEREDMPAYMPSVTREALANALCHRDYAQAWGNITMAMYDDRLEIINSGGLHFGLTPESLTVPHTSKPWNPLIAGVFYRAGITESWGSGTLRILEACRAEGRPEPYWSIAGLPSVCPSQLPSCPPNHPGSYP